MRSMRAIRVSGFFDNSGSRLLLGGAVLLLILMVSPRQGQAQACDNQDSIYSGGTYCISATGLMGNNPQMPVLNIGGGSGRCSSQYIMELDFAQPGDSYGNGESYGYYNSGSLPGGGQWVVDWSLNLGDVGEYSEGGNGDIQDFEDGTMVDEFPFFVYGQNPTTSPSITTALGLLGPPWWFGHALTDESSNRQFYIWQNQYDPSGTYTGTPIFGQPDGFGLTQVDGVPNPLLLTDDVMWTWTTNLLTGVGIANQKSLSAQTYIQNQITNMVNYTSPRGLAPIYPDPENYSSICSFTYPGSGNSAYWNLEWMTEYNGGNWTQWQASSLSWPIIAPVTCNPKGVCSIYAYRLCTNQTATI